MRTLLCLTVLSMTATASFAQEPETSEAPAAKPAEAQQLNPLSSLDKATLEGFRDMPLFTPSRRRPDPPPEVEAEAPPPPPAPKRATPAPAPEITLAGIVLGPEGAVAVVQSGAGKVERLRLGDQIGGWLVTGIESAALKLTLEEREEEYRLFERADASKSSSGDRDTTGKDDDGDEPEL